MQIWGEETWCSARLGEYWECCKAVLLWGSASPVGINVQMHCQTARICSRFFTKMLVSVKYMWFIQCFTTICFLKQTWLLRHWYKIWYLHIVHAKIFSTLRVLHALHTVFHLIISTVKRKVTTVILFHQGHYNLISFPTRTTRKQSYKHESPVSWTCFIINSFILHYLLCYN